MREGCLLTFVVSDGGLGDNYPSLVEAVLEAGLQLRQSSLEQDLLDKDLRTVQVYLIVVRHIFFTKIHQWASIAAHLFLE